MTHFVRIFFEAKRTRAALLRSISVESYNPVLTILSNWNAFKSI